MVTFPLLQLPLVAMEHVLCMMSPFELIDVSLALSRAKRVVKSFSRTKKQFFVHFDNFQHSISFRRGIREWSYVMKNNEVHAQFYSNLYKDQKNTDLIMKVSKEPLKDVIKWYDYAREVLNCKIKSLFFRLHSSSSEHRQTIDWIAAQNKTMKFTSVLNEIEELDDDLKYFMETIQILEGFYLMVNKHKDDFRIEIPGKPKCLHIGNAQFIDYNQLLRLKSPVIVLQKSILTNEEINRFLRSWMSCETHLDLEALQINILGPNAMNEIMDLPHEKTNALNLVQAFYDYHMIRQVINEMFTLKRCNGKKRATVTTGRSGDDWTLYLVVH